MPIATSIPDQAQRCEGTMALKTKPLLWMSIGVLPALAAATAGISAELLRDD
jgi:hypothetical protein